MDSAFNAVDISPLMSLSILNLFYMNNDINDLFILKIIDYIEDDTSDEDNSE